MMLPRWSGIRAIDSRAVGEKMDLRHTRGGRVE